MFKDDEIKRSWTEIDDSIIQNVTTLLKDYNYDLLDNLIYFVSAICEIDPYDMLSVNDKIQISQARWLLWYSWRYMTHESYEKIACRACIEGHRFKTRGVAAGIEKMSKIIEQETIWSKRWAIIKHIIKMWKKKDDAQEKSEILLNVPQNVEVKIIRNKTQKNE